VHPGVSMNVEETSVTAECLQKSQARVVVLAQLLCDRSSSLSTGSDWSAARSDGLSVDATRSVKPLVSSCGLRGVDFGVGVRLSSRVISGGLMCSCGRCCS
jgi:hypothetical protein